MYRPRIIKLSLCFVLVLFIMSLETSAVEAASAGLATAGSACGGWNVVPSPSPGSENQNLLGVAAISSNNVSAVGYADRPDLTEQWNGAQWSVIPSPGPGKGGNVLNGAALIPGTSQLWAVGYFYKLRGYRFTLTKQWNGTKWVTVSSPNPNKGKGDNELDAVAAISANDAWAVGDTVNASGAQNTLTEHWNGTQWSVVPSPNPGGAAGAPHSLYAVAAVSTNDVWAVGSDLNASNVTQTLILHWNGASWSVMKSPNVGPFANELLAVTAVSTSDVWAVGDYLSVKANTLQTLIEHWNGQKWSVVSSPDPTFIDNQLYGVAAVSANNIWAVGDYTTPDIVEQTLIEHWDGNAWSVVSSPNVGQGSMLDAVTSVPGTSELWAVGSYYNGVIDQTLIEHYC